MVRINQQFAVRSVLVALLAGVAGSELLGVSSETQLAYGRDIYHPKLSTQMEAADPQPDSTTSRTITTELSEPRDLMVIDRVPFDAIPAFALLASDSSKQGSDRFRFASNRSRIGSTRTAKNSGRWQDEREASTDSHTRDRIEDLIAQLGHDDFRQREAASLTLGRVGIPAIHALELALDHPDREVRYRASRILNTIQKVHLERRLGEFLNGQPLSDESQLPGWRRYRELVGDDEQTRHFFVELQKSEHRLLLLVNEEPVTIAKSLARRIAELHGLFRDPNERVEDTTVAALLMLAGMPDVELDEPTYVSLYYLCNNAGFHDAIKLGSQRRILQRLIAPWLAKSDWSTAYQSLVLGLRYDVDEVLSLAKEILADRENAATHVQRYAIESVAKFGSIEDVELLAPLLNDDTRLHARTVGERSIVTEMRDLALAASIHVAGERLRDFGFADAAFHEEFVFIDSSLGFESTAHRDAAFEKWSEFQKSLRPTEGSTAIRD